jgi:hypothetical protein
MERYAPRSSKTIIGFAAAFMTAATLALAVVAPAGMDFSSGQVGVQTLASDAPRTAAVNATSPTTSVEVVALRRTMLVPVVHSSKQAKHGIES